MIGPNTRIAAVNHPLTPKGRREHRGIGKPVTVGSDVRIGGCTILPGGTIGEGSAIGAGSVAAKNIPPRVIAAGNPCRVIREITKDDALDKAAEI